MVTSPEVLETLDVPVAADWGTVVSGDVLILGGMVMVEVPEVLEDTAVRTGGVALVVEEKALVPPLMVEVLMLGAAVVFWIETDTARVEEARSFEVALVFGLLESGLILEDVGTDERWLDGGDEG